jgi:hypothetical protein
MMSASNDKIAQKSMIVEICDVGATSASLCGPGLPLPSLPVKDQASDVGIFSMHFPTIGNALLAARATASHFAQKTGFVES